MFHQIYKFTISSTLCWETSVSVTIFMYLYVQLSLPFSVEWKSMVIGSHCYQH